MFAARRNPRDDRPTGHFRDETIPMRALLSAAAVGGLLLPAGFAHAWGDDGHKIVCEIAFQELTSEARSAVIELIRADDEFRFFNDSCTWPDMFPRRRGSEHYVNLPRDTTELTQPCPVADNLGEDPLEVAAALRSSITDAERQEWTAGDIDVESVMGWANESYAIALAPETEYCVQKENACWYSEDDRNFHMDDEERVIRVDQDYITRNAPQVAERL